jgi:KDO2-lipid IV(A) lauroyltransferase
MTSTAPADARNALTTLADYSVYLIVRLVFCVIQALPLAWCDSLARGCAVVLNDWIGFRRKVLADNLGHVFPDLSPEERSDISRQMWHHLILMACEVALAPRLIHDTNWRQYFSIRNRRALVGSILENRPVVLVAGHFGNFELGGFLCGVLGAPTYTVARTLDNPFLNRFINDFRQRSGQFILPKDGSSDLIEVALQQGKMLTLLGDQHGGDKGVWIDFLGRPASCHKALALFTLSSGAPMVVVASRRTRGPLQFEVDFGGVADPNDLPPELQSVRGLTEWYNARIADQVLKSPEQYWWVHKRWKPKAVRKKPSEGVPATPLDAADVKAPARVA